MNGWGRGGVAPVHPSPTFPPLSAPPITNQQMCKISQNENFAMSLLGVGGTIPPPSPGGSWLVPGGGGEGGITCDCQAEAVLEAKMRLTKIDKPKLN